MTNDESKRWMIANYDYIKNNMITLSKEARLLFSATDAVKYLGYATVNGGDRVYYMPRLSVNYDKLLEEIAKTDFVERHSQVKEYFGVCPLFVFFCFGQVMFDKLPELLEEHKKPNMFYSVNIRCFYRYMLMFIQCHFEHIQIYENGTDKFEKSFNCPVVFPIIHLNEFAPIVNVIEGVQSGTPMISTKISKEIEFDRMCFSKYKFVEANPIMH